MFTSNPINIITGSINIIPYIKVFLVIKTELCPKSAIFFTNAEYIPHITAANTANISPIGFIFKINYPLNVITAIPIIANMNPTKKLIFNFSFKNIEANIPVNNGPIATKIPTFDAKE